MSKYQGNTDANDLVYSTNGGLNKIEYMATQIMQGLVANSEIKLDSRMAARFAVKYAETLIEELNEVANESA